MRDLVATLILIMGIYITLEVSLAVQEVVDPATAVQNLLVIILCVLATGGLVTFILKGKG